MRLKALQQLEIEGVIIQKNTVFVANEQKGKHLISSGLAIKTKDDFRDIKVK